MARNALKKSRRKRLTLTKHGYQGICHKFNPKYLDRYVTGFAGRRNDRDADTANRMVGFVAGMDGKRLRYRGLTADNGRSNGAE